MRWSKKSHCIRLLLWECRPSRPSSGRAGLNFGWVKWLTASSLWFLFTICRSCSSHHLVKRGRNLPTMWLEYDPLCEYISILGSPDGNLMFCWNSGLLKASIVVCKSPFLSYLLPLFQKRVFARNHSTYENVFPLQIHFHANQTHFHMKRFFEKEAQGNSEMAC